MKGFVASVITVVAFAGVAWSQSPRMADVKAEVREAEVRNPEASDLTRWARFAKGEHPDYLYDKGIQSVDTDIVWCVWHEGLMHQKLTTDAFRAQCAPMHKGAASRNRVLSASNREIRSILDTMDRYFDRPENGGYKMLYTHLHWVLHHEGERVRILNLLDQRKFDEIRSVYHGQQSHNAHVEYMIFAASDRTLESMLDQM